MFVSDWIIFALAPRPTFRVRNHDAANRAADKKKWRKGHEVVKEYLRLF